MRKKKVLRRRYGHSYKRDPDYSPMPAWVLGIESACLREVVREAIDAKSWARDAGADEKSKLWRSAEEAIAQVKAGQLAEAKACRKAAVAARKFNSAGEQT